MESVYIIKCANNKYYVGRSIYPQQQIQQHFNGDGSRWTRIHPPIQVLEIRNTSDVDRCLLECMAKYGVENVRGGSCPFPKLSIEQRTRIYEQIDIESGIIEHNDIFDSWSSIWWEIKDMYEFLLSLFR